MKQKKYISIFIILSLFLWVFIVYANDENESSYSLKQEYQLYKERVKNICDPYKAKKPLIHLKNDYSELTENDEFDFDQIKKDHRSNMNNIYKCALLNVQKKSLLLIKKDLVKKNPTLAKKVETKIDTKVSRIKLSLSSLECIDTKTADSIQKKNVLDQTTYQTCKYVNYLEYLKEYNDQVWNLVPNGDAESEQSFSISSVLNEEENRLLAIDDEIEHTYKVFPMAFHAYTEYENNISIHFLLELLRDDYTVLRQKLHDSLNPINQSVYKISSAMIK